MIGISDIVNRIGELQPLSPTVPRLAKTVADPNSCVDDVVAVIRFDQALTLDVLKLANSVMSASSKKIVEIKDAVVRLGGARILQQVMARHVQKDLQSPMPGYGYSEDELWRHSVASALAVEAINTYAVHPVSGVAFTAALLHDIGKLLISRTVPMEDMNNIWKTLSANDGIASRMTCEMAEKKVLGFSHAEVGWHVAAAWGLPDEITLAIRDHHAAESINSPITDGVKIANIVARIIGEGVGVEGMAVSIESDIADRVGLSREHFEMVCADTSCKLTEVFAMYR